MSSHEFQTLYPDYDVLDKWQSPSWNAQTRAVVGKRLHDVPQRRCFTALQWTTLEAVCDRVIPQPERSERVAIVPWIDARLYK